MNKQSKNFIYTAIGAAFGMGAVTRFPALCLEYGGAFIIAYAVVLAAVALPLLSGELRVGSRSGGGAFRDICPFGGAVGGLSAVNSAVLCACYGVIICVFFVRGCTSYSAINYNYPADMPQLTPFICAIVFIALAFFLTRRARTRARVARAAVFFQAGMLIVLAVRGLMYSNSFAVLGQVFCVRPALFLSGGMWLSALGQALLSLSVAAGVMPAFAREMPKSLSPVRGAAAITAFNFCGSLLAAVSTLSLAGGGGCLEELTHSALANALTLYPAALSYAFSNGHICGLFCCAFYCSLTLTAFVSALSLARPAYVWLCRAPVSSRTAAFILCAALYVVCLPFALGVSVGVADSLCCGIVAPVCAAGEAGCFLFYVLTARKRRDKIKVWKKLNS